MIYSPMGNYYEDRTEEYRRHMTKTYGLMAIGLGITFAASLLTAIFLPGLVFNFTLAVILLLLEVVTVIAFSSLLHRARYGTVVGMFFFYALLTGVSISYILALYDLSNIFLCFAATALSFSIMALLGHSTKRDLSVFGQIFFSALIGLILLTVVGLFLNVAWFEILISSFGLILFLGITAYDAQKAKRLFESGASGDDLSKFAVYSAMQFYLDFINIFLYIVRLFGRSRN